MNEGALEQEAFIDPSGEWLVELSKSTMDILLSVLVLYYLPYIAILFVTLLAFRLCPNQRTKVLVIPITIWAGIWLVGSMPLLLLLPCYLETRNTTGSIIRAVGRRM